MSGCHPLGSGQPRGGRARVPRRRFREGCGEVLRPRGSMCEARYHIFTGERLGGGLRRRGHGVGALRPKGGLPLAAEVELLELRGEQRPQDRCHGVVKLSRRQRLGSGSGGRTALGQKPGFSACKRAMLPPFCSRGLRVDDCSPQEWHEPYCGHEMRHGMTPCAMMRLLPETL